ncbi:signal transduction histidine kinase [Flavobacterium limnosediminis JC2902]|uniref:histidine kinase n=1 Tax=Flavobacterium limnosediminis JC2902 TaxID=1341181 RepID=V6SQS9_9FLAO|nr:response regulator [Flavobacterium limnosediminis]ESU29001.1 signal transduction histidine kinase [Flavobacterium limnosediminis JC2902]
MWKSFSIKTQLILILLIPILGLIYMTTSNIKFSLNNYKSIDHSLGCINNIASLSRGISEISVERGFYVYSIYDPSKMDRFGVEKQKTLDWFTSTKFNDTVIANNLISLKASILELQSDIERKKDSNVTTFVKYTLLNKTLYNLIEREIVNCEHAKLTKLANNYYNYVTLREAMLLKRGVVLQKIINNEKQLKLDDSLLELYFKAKDYESVVDFKLANSDSNDVNRNLINFRKSDSVSDLNADAESIIENKSDKTTESWWKESNAVISKLKESEKKNLAYILDYANDEKEAALKSILLSTSLLLIFLLVVISLTYKLISNLSKTLVSISSSIKKISMGEMIEDQDFVGNREFDQIRSAFNGLLAAKRNHIDLALKIGSGVFGATIPVRSDKDILNKSLNSMSLELDRLNKDAKEISLMEKSIIEVNKSIVESKDLYDFGANICQTIVQQTQGCQANFYVLNESESTDQLYRIGGYADDKSTQQVIAVGEGLVGEVAKINEQKCLNNLPGNYSYIASSLGKSPYYNVLITPVSYKKEVIGVIEIGSLENFDESHKKLLNAVSRPIGSAIEVFVRNEELKKSVDEINRKNNILQIQEEELRQSNDELNRQAVLLQQSEEELRNQAAELEQTNAYLEDQRHELEEKNHEVEIKNNELFIAHQDLNKRAEEIEQASKYKSEFLANMSHELRTPLNSILILSDILKENSAGNLTEAQIDNLSVINSSGNDLLGLITDILDISKIESGKVEFHAETATVEKISSEILALFQPQMLKKNIEFTSILSDDCPGELNTDIGKLEQIIKNFLSNAHKFTPENGKVTLRFSSANGKEYFNSPFLSQLAPYEILSVHIEDNGIGISEENKTKLFQSFQQADSSTSRKFGGTGLGLYISKELSHILGGEVDFESELNKGSIFSVYIPAIFKVSETSQQILSETVLDEKQEIVSKSEQAKPEITIDLSENLNDDRNKVTYDDKTILIIEDDVSFAEVLLQVAHDNGFKAIIAHQGETGFQYVKQYKPKAIILDMKLPGIDGWTVLKWLKEDKEMHHIPVHVMSGMDREKLATEMGAFDFLMKPITVEKLKSAFESIETQIAKVFKKVLILEDDVNLNYSIKGLVENTYKNVICIQAHTLAEAEDVLKNDLVDCAIMDIGLSDSNEIKSIEKLRKISKNKDINIIVNTGRSLSQEEELELQGSVDGIVIKTANVTDRLKDELVLFLDKVKSPNEREYEVNEDLLGGGTLTGKKILIVDDDIRNIYALSSALTAKGGVVLTAFNGIEALEVLEKNSDVDVVLMDIMMPEMDGFEATRKIREKYEWKNLPIIALTAKAMKGDREEILNAGASDYQSKPIDIQKLISLISIWIYK